LHTIYHFGGAKINKNAEPAQRDKISVCIKPFPSLNFRTFAASKKEQC